MKSNALKGTVRSIGVLVSAAALGGVLTQAAAGTLPHSTEAPQWPPRTTTHPPTSMAPP